ncbi:MAG: hypothetical protein M0Z73_14275 [Betaproteobacteria bacterium]|nr:hypothetical protein [Betaproteobacteria bacterium]
MLDYVADYVIIDGTPSTLNPQYQSLKTIVQNWIGNGTLTGVSTTIAPSIGSTADSTLSIALDDGSTLNLQAALYGMDAEIQFANGDALALESWVGENLTQSVTLVLDSIVLGSGEPVTSAYGGAAADQIWGGNGNDTIKGYGGNDQLVGNAGDDTIYGGIGNDRLFGLAGSDVLDGEDGNDELQGGDGGDVLRGGGGDDSVIGQDGNDTLDSGSGNDTLTDKSAAALAANGYTAQPERRAA